MLEKKYDFKRVENDMQKLWSESKVYAFDNESSTEIYSIDTPPPTVSGSLHIGHIFSYTQAEMIARFQRMQGKNVFYPFGFDDNGLPTERLVEKEKNILAKDMTRSEFNEKCLETTSQYVEQFKNLWQSLGFSVDWELQYETISPQSQRISQKSFIELVRIGKAYSKESPVLWCTECHTSIAQAELESLEKETTFNYITFKVGEENLIIATTRPELLYGCVCLFINPEDHRYNKYIGKNAMVPIYNYEVPILGDEKVSIDKGTGVVMCATFGDTTDVEWYEKYKLPYRKIILPDGRIDEDVPLIGGIKINEARKIIIEELMTKNLLIKVETLIHNVGIHERCNKEIEIIPSRQWYIDVLTDKKLFLEASDRINWYPEYIKIRYKLWVENLKWDWCISRQRYFGVPFPIWYCKDCGKVITASEDMLPVNPLEASPKEKCSCGCNEFIPESAVLDTWATSSLTPQINKKWRESDEISSPLAPMSMRTQAHEIIRTWAFYTIVKSLYHAEEIPWKDIMICGFVMAKKGEKISKSKNNSKLAPKELIEVYSADVIRYWAANSKLGTDTMFSEEELKISSRFINKLWNASKFTISHLNDFDNTSTPNLMAVDRWIIEKCKETTNAARNFLNKYEVGSARHEIDDFFWKDFCDYYLEIVKDRVYKPEIHGAEQRKSAQYALYYCLLEILKLYAIYVPHITEYIYQNFFREFEKTISLHSHCWNHSDHIDNTILKFGEELKETVANTRKYKSEKNLSLKDEIDSITIDCNDEFIPFFIETKGDLIACCHAKNLIIK